MSNKLCGTASSGHLKVNYQVTGKKKKKSSCTVAKYKESGKRTWLEKEKNFFFAPNYFRPNARAHKTRIWQEPLPCSSSLLDAVGKVALELDE